MKKNLPHIRGLVWIASASLLLGILLLPPGCNDDEKPRQRQVEEVERLRTQVTSLSEGIGDRDRHIEQLRTQLAKALSSSWGSLTSLALVGIVAFIIGVAVGAQGLRAYRDQHKEPTHGSSDHPPSTL